MPTKNDDRDNNILYRGKFSYIVLNLYPYSTGHTMIVPNRHVSDYTSLQIDELAETSQLTQKAIISLSKAFNPDGFNLGINQGKVAGAGIDEHLHIHIVPRWNGDNNFISVTGKTKVISFSLSKVYNKLLQYY
jgi:ATP adenylyltransferase|tara:strand:- start:17240 stop:17638 length:399 start_codon:yes stop_codon:yes gene_type:complete